MEQNNQKVIKRRNSTMDILRIVACFMVITQHVLADDIYDTWTNNKTLLVILDSFAQGAVPLFFMLSGAFSASTSVKKAIKKSLYLFILFVLFKCFFAFWDCYYFDKDITFNLLYYSHRITDLCSYKYHLWFMPEFIALTLIAPIINSAVRQNKYIDFYISILFILFGFILPHSFPVRIHGYEINVIEAILESVPINVPCSLGYFCLGKTIFNHVVTPPHQKKYTHQYIIMLTGIFWLSTNIITCIMTLNRSIEKGAFDYSLLSRSGFNILIADSLLFTLFTLLSAKHDSKLTNPRNSSISNAVDFVIPHCLFIYLIHPLFVDALTLLGLRPLTYNPFISVPAKILLVFMLSLGLSIIVKGLKTMIQKPFKH